MMFLPWLQGFVGVLKSPATWFLFTLNLLCAVFTFPLEWQADQGTDKLINHEFLVQSGKFYQSYLENNPTEGADLVRKLASVRETSEERIELIGAMGLRDHQFLTEAPMLDFGGDEIMVGEWKGQVKNLNQVLDRYPASIWGLSTANHGSIQWISHAFVHSGWNHLIGNMYFLLIFGAAVEMWLGSFAFLFGYLGAGLFSAMAYIVLQGGGGAPIVGASGAISGVMGMYCIKAFREKVPFVYMLLPIPYRAFMGTFMAPAGVALILWMLQDVTGLLGTPSGMGGVAHAAHLGGFAAGFVFGALIYRLGISGKPQLTPEEARTGIVNSPLIKLPPAVASNRPPVPEKFRK